MTSTDWVKFGTWEFFWIVRRGKAISIRDKRSTKSMSRYDIITRRRDTFESGHEMATGIVMVKLHA